MSHPVLFYRKRIKLPWTTPHSRTQFLSYYLSMDDLTSGFNIGTNYTLNPQFNEMTGFTEKDVRDMLEYYSTTCPFNHSVDELIELIAFLLRNADHQRNSHRSFHRTVCMVCIQKASKRPGVVYPLNHGFQRHTCLDILNCCNKNRVPETGLCF